MIYISNWAEHTIELAEQFGVGVEISDFCFPEEYDNRFSMQRKVENTLKRISQRSYHGLIQNDIDYFNSDWREYWMGRLSGSYEFAKRMGSKNLVLHCAITPKKFENTACLQRAIIFWGDFMRKNGDELNVYLENVYEQTPELLADLIDEVGHPKLKACFDCGHANLYSQVGTEEWVSTLGSRIGHVHINNNYGEKDNHYGFGKGSIDLAAMLNQIGEVAPEANLVVEQLPEYGRESLMILVNRRNICGI